MSIIGKKSYKQHIKRLLPWIVGLFIICFLFFRIDAAAFINSLKIADVRIYFPLVICFIMLWFFIEAFNIQKLYEYFGHHVDYSTMLSIRGCTYLLMVINYGLGVGAIALYLKKIRGVTLRRSTGILGYYMVVESSALSFLASAGYILAGSSSGIQQWVFYLALGLLFFYNIEILVFKYLPASGVLKKIVNSSIMLPVRESTLSIYLRIFFQRTCYFMTFVIFFYFAVRAFHMQIPPMTLMALVPIIFFIGNLPITPFGLGTIQAAMLYFFNGFSTQANILAMSLVYTVSLMVLRALIGLYYIKNIEQFIGMQASEEQGVVHE